jgi:hypothetical protein
MASITVDVDLDDFDLDELLDEVECRYNRYKKKLEKKYCSDSKKQIEDWAEDLFNIEKPNINLSLLDTMKIDFLMQNLDKIKLNDLENLI